MRSHLTFLLLAFLALTGCHRGNRYGFVDIASSEKTLGELTDGFLSACDTAGPDRRTFLLSQGTRVADVLSYGAANLPEVPCGYAVDTLSLRTLLEDLHVKHNRLYTEDGRNYRILFLGKDTLTTAELTALADLSAAGAFIGGLHPAAPAAPADPADSAAFFSTVERVWVSGNVMSGRTMRSILNAADVLQDLKTRVDSVEYEHRHLSDAEIYHIRYCGDTPVRAKLKFRVTGRQPSVWDPGAGTIADVTYKIRKNKTKVVLDLMPGDERFIVFCPYADHHKQRF